MPKRTEDAVKRTYRFGKTLLAQVEKEAARNRRAVNTQIELMLEEWLAKQDRKKEDSAGDRAPAQRAA